MKTPERPANENQRLSALEQSQLLDTPPEERYDRVTRLAARLFKVPVALVSLVDKDRQWFKSCYGLGVRETARDISFCGHAILAADTFIVENALNDHRFADNPLVTGEPSIRFYAGAPLEDRSGNRLGTLCLIDRQPRGFSEDDKRNLRDLADIVEREFQYQELGSYFGERTRALNILNEIALDNEGSESERVERALKTANHFLGTDTAIVSDITGQTYTIRWHHERRSRSLHNGLSLPLDRTYCAMLLEQGEILAISHMAKSRYRNHACYQTFGLESYLAAPIWLDDKIVGTLNFSSERPHRPAFSESEKMFVTLLARWVATTLESQRSEQLKNQFISTVSHELRTPLTSIAGSLGLILGGATGDLPDKTRQMLTIARRNTDQLRALIDDLLDIEKLVSGKMPVHLGPHHVEEAVEAAIEEIRPYARPRMIGIRLHRAPSTVTAVLDPMRLKQALTNLLSNAVKYSPDGGEVQVRIVRQESSVRIEIIDQGPGVPTAFRDRIFQKFAQADASPSRAKEGTGLGLAITRELMLAMGGNVGYESEEGSGATFWVSLPLPETTES
ncbi:sensor histidine kinase [Marinobacter shengliensis]|uniref:sensor histidine kinase n=1 Tax=Marinobacter shengliensis TaxID=1389223 RepID=UPI000D0EE17A|nr:GAF domain-containing protein [Marinobacter shengliensis]PSF14715.1 histidine kinase [Marinobacter shengliensis]